MTLKSDHFLSWVTPGQTQGVFLRPQRWLFLPWAAFSLHWLAVSNYIDGKAICHPVEHSDRIEHLLAPFLPQVLCVAGVPSQRQGKNMGLTTVESAHSVSGSKAHKAEEGCKGSRGRNEPSCPIPPNPAYWWDSARQRECSHGIQLTDFTRSRVDIVI